MYLNILRLVVVGWIPVLTSGFLVEPGTTPASPSGTITSRSTTYTSLITSTSTTPTSPPRHTSTKVTSHSTSTSVALTTRGSPTTCTTPNGCQCTCNTNTPSAGGNHQDTGLEGKVSALKIENEDLQQAVRQLQQDINNLQQMSSELTCARDSVQQVASDVNKLLSNHVVSNGTISPPANCTPSQVVTPSPGATTGRPRDCHDVYDYNTADGVYSIQPDNYPNPGQVYCSQGWTYLQKRIDGSFDQYWDTYLMGFGNLTTDFWLGNMLVHFMTIQANYSLRIEATGWTGKSYWAEYEQFYTDSEANKFAVHLSNYSGNYQGPLEITSTPIPFTTKDQDNDLYNFGNCGQTYRGGWWYTHCGSSRLTADHIADHAIDCMSFSGRCVKTSLMKVIPSFARTQL